VSDLQAKEERMVEHDVLALEGRRLKGSLVAAAHQIAGLENRKAQLRFSMEERKQEIQVPACFFSFICWLLHFRASIMSSYVSRAT
jgi:hypothetical protein